MDRLQPKDQVGTWQLIPVNVNCETSADISMVERLLKPECARAPACNLFVTGNEILGRAKSDVARLCVLR